MTGNVNVWVKRRNICGKHKELLLDIFVLHTQSRSWADTTETDIHLIAALDSVDYNILLHGLEHWVGFSGMVIKCLRSNLQDSLFCLHCRPQHKRPQPVVPQGSILGTLL